jgi:hypothetical protein
VGRTDCQQGGEPVEYETFQGCSSKHMLSTFLINMKGYLFF